jgi:hypothetical protein
MENCKYLNPVRGQDMADLPVYLERISRLPGRPFVTIPLHLMGSEHD